MPRHFIKLYVDGRETLCGLPDNELAALVRMAMHIRFRDNTVTNRGGRPMTQEEIAQILGKSLRQTKTVLAALERRGLVEPFYRGRVKHYRLTDTLVYRGGGP